jgi:23S rRNA (cytidine1920-2'-O)/16S rRNA (cytidine1409-2'-O)-methyltransferase
VKQRLDVALVERGLAETREKAKALVMAGRVKVDGEPGAKPGTPVPPEAQLEVQPGPAHVGRGALKLAGALDAFSVAVGDRVAVDVGSSTGGFTEVLLARGATRVYAVDVGHNQLHEKLRADPRVVVREGVNARELGAADVPEPCGLAVMDVSFISVTKILPALRGVLEPQADVVVLVKPQFEVGRGQVGRGGIVRDAALHKGAMQGVADAARTLGYAVLGAAPSPVTGAEGNREFFLHLRPAGPGLDEASIGAAIEKAVTE